MTTDKLETAAAPEVLLHDIPPGLVRTVTRSPAKARLYGVDNYFRESSRLFGDDLDDVLRTTLCVLKPEAAAGRRYRPALDALRDNGFRPVDAVRFRHHRLTVRETWRFQLNFASRERIDAMDLVLGTSDSVMLVLRDEQWTPGDVPAAVRLTALKGPSDPAQRRPEHLRSRLGAVNGLFNFTHTSDEPIDVMREIAIVCDEERRRLLHARVRAGHDAVPEALAAFAELEAETPAHDLDLENSWRRLAAAEGPAGEPARLRAAGREVPVRLIAAALRAGADGPAQHWDLLSVLTHSLRFNEPGIGRIFPNVLLESWQNAPAVPA
ncbi:nucleoside-diphosphate kinase [Kitasatospora sp. NPDC058184]|uniref:nucleoside-diphosphate kinase n=1 Tax=Kitasatospora sp. NPDC058184 TaxID=3346370 RepID=UPI0036DA12CA